MFQYRPIEGLFLEPQRMISSLVMIFTVHMQNSRCLPHVTIYLKSSLCQTQLEPDPDLYFGEKNGTRLSYFNDRTTSYAPKILLFQFIVEQCPAVVEHFFGEVPQTGSGSRPTEVPTVHYRCIDRETNNSSILFLFSNIRFDRTLQRY